MSSDRPRIEIENDRVYARLDGRRDAGPEPRALHYDVYFGAGDAAAKPGLLLVHGGGWRRGSRDAMRGYGIRLAQAGTTCVAIEYRLTPESPWPAQIHDVKRALRFVRAHAAELGIDPDRIALQGSSAGAHLALLAAGTPGDPTLAPDAEARAVEERVSAVVAVYPPTLFYAGGERPSGALAAQALMGRAATPELARQASPLAYVSKEFPPTLLLHGTADRIVPPSASLRMYEALSEAGVPAGLHLFAEQPHGFARQPSHQPLLAATIALFLDQYV